MLYVSHVFFKENGYAEFVITASSNGRRSNPRLELDLLCKITMTHAHGVDILKMVLQSEFNHRTWFHLCMDQ